MVRVQGNQARSEDYCVYSRPAPCLKLVAWSGKVSIHVSPESSPAVPSLKSERVPVETLRTLFDCDPGEWQEGFTAFRDRWLSLTA